MILWGNKRRLGLSVGKERVMLETSGHQEATDDEAVVDMYLRLSHKFI